MLMNDLEEYDASMGECTTHLGGLSQTETQLSTAWLAIINDRNNKEVIEISSYYKHTLPLFGEMTT